MQKIHERNTDSRPRRTPCLTGMDLNTLKPAMNGRDTVAPTKVGEAVARPAVLSQTDAGTKANATM